MPQQTPDIDRNARATSRGDDWQRGSWRTRPRVQMPDYPDAQALAGVEAQLAKFGEYQEALKCCDDTPTSCEQSQQRKGAHNARTSLLMEGSRDVL